MNYWYAIEIIIIVAVIVWQIWHTISIRSKILKFKGIFCDKLRIEQRTVETREREVVELPLVDTTGRNEILLEIKEAINTYLTNNFGASVNFSLIKDIIDREVEVKDEEITQSIALPLYLGLAATMVGIIFGLFSMPSLDGDGFDKGINTLIDGVKIAMFGSVFGLAFTTYLSSFVYKTAKGILQREKNEQLTYLQAHLLPELIKADETGVSGLKASLDKFARDATDLSDNVLTAAEQTSKNLVLQHELVGKVEKMNVLKVSKWNLELFEKMEGNMEAFSRFATYIERMEQVSSHLLAFSERTADVTQMVDNINSSVSESRELTRFLSSHLKGMENLGNATLASVGHLESHFEEALRSLNTRTQGMIDHINKSAGTHEASLENMYVNLSQITNKFEEVIHKSAGTHEASLENIYTSMQTNLNQVANQLEEVINKSAGTHEARLENMYANLSQITNKFEEVIHKSAGTHEASLENIYTSMQTNLNQVANKLEEVINKSAGTHEASLENIYTSIQTNLSQVTNQYIKSFEGAFSESIPNFKLLLDKLEQLENLSQVANQHIETFTEAFSESIPNFKQLDRLEQLEHLSQMTNQHIETFTGDFSESVPSFKQLDKLERLERFSHITSHLLRDLQKHFLELIPNFKQLDRLEQLENLSQVANQDIQAFLEAFSESIPNFKQLDRLEQLENLSQVANQDIQAFLEAFSESIPNFKQLDRLEQLENLSQAANQDIQAFSEAFSESIPNFKQLDRLEQLESLSQVANQYIEGFTGDFLESMPNFKQLDKLEQLEIIKVSLQQLPDNREISHKLDEISSALASKHKEKNPHKSRNTKQENSSSDTTVIKEVKEEVISDHPPRNMFLVWKEVWKKIRKKT